MDTLILGGSPGKGFLLGRMSKYPAEFREQAVAMVRETGKPLAQVARDLGLNESTLWNWVNRERAERGEHPEAEVLSASEKEELRRLRRENAQLRMEREILKRAAAFNV